MGAARQLLKKLELKEGESFANWLSKDTKRPNLDVKLRNFLEGLHARVYPEATKFSTTTRSQLQLFQRTPVVLMPVNGLVGGGVNTSYANLAQISNALKAQVFCMYRLSLMIPFYHSNILINFCIFESFGHFPACTY
jgi:hypothetical protein